MKNIIVTGASQGIGREVVLNFIRKGHKVIAISRNSKKLEELSSINQSSNFHYLSFDITNFEKYDDIIHSVKDFFKSKVDILINNAGILIKKPFSEFSILEFEKIYKTNVFSAVKMIQILIPFFSHSQVVNISSIGGLERTLKFAGLSAYSSSKAALNSITEILAKEYDTDKFRINSFALGAIQTQMLEQAFPDFKASTQPEEIAEFITDFCLKYGKLFHGIVLPISTSSP